MSVTTKRPALGRGLTSLMNQIAPEDASQRELPIGSLLPNRHQPRSYFDEEALDDLATSLKRYAPQCGHIQIAGCPDRHEPDTGEVRYDLGVHAVGTALNVGVMQQFQGGMADLSPSKL